MSWRISGAMNRSFCSSVPNAAMVVAMSPIDVGGSSPADGTSKRDSSARNARTYELGRPRPPSATGHVEHRVAGVELEALPPLAGEQTALLLVLADVVEHGDVVASLTPHHRGVVLAVGLVDPHRAGCRVPRARRGPPCGRVRGRGVRSVLRRCSRPNTVRASFSGRRTGLATSPVGDYCHTGYGGLGRTRDRSGGGTTGDEVGLSLLEVQDVTVRFGGIVALDGLSFDIGEGQICGLIGPNGAGKTTMFNVVSRIYQPTSGKVMFRGQNLIDAPAHGIARLGNRPHLPEPRAVPHDDPARERDGGSAFAGQGRLRQGRVPDRCEQGERSDAGVRRRTAAPARPRAAHVPSGDGAAVRHAQAARDRPRPRSSPDVPADGRTGERAHPRRGRRARRHHRRGSATSST